MSLSPRFGRWPAGWAAATALTAALLAPSSALAEWRLSGNTSSTVEAVTDRERKGDNDPAFGATGTLNLSLTARDPRTQWQTNVGVVGAKFVGPGAEGDFNRLDPNLVTTLSHRLGLWTFGANGSFDAQPSSVTQLEDTGLTDEDVIQFTSRIGLSTRYRVSPRDTVGLNFDATAIEFSEENDQLTPSLRFNAGGNLRHAVDQGLSTTFTLGVSRLIADDAEETVSTSANAGAGFTYDLDNRLSFNLNLGPSITQRETSNPEVSEISFGAIGAGGLSWRPTQSTSLGFEASQGLETGGDGELENVTRASFDVSHAIDQTFSSAFALSISRRSADTAFLSTESDIDVLSASPSINLALDRDVRATAGYTLTVSREDGQQAMSNRIFITLTTDF